MSETENIETIFATITVANECYENLETQLFSGNINEAQTLKSLKACETQIANIAKLVDNNIFYAALLQVQYRIREQMKRIEQISLKGKAPVTSSTNSPTMDFAVNKTSAYYMSSSRNVVIPDEQEKLLEIIKETKVVPKIQGFNEVAGLETIKSTLERLVILPTKQPQLYSKLKTGNCILLFGPPGTGKTKIVHALAVEAKAALYCVGASSIMSSYVGQTEKILRTLFLYMKTTEAPKILFIDEIDGLCRHRTDNEAEYNRRLKTEFMSQLSDFVDNQKAFLICATNCPWDLDVAFMRRFQERIYVPLPDYMQRFNLLKLYTKGTALEETSQSWDPVLQKTEGFSGSDLNDLVQQALQIPIMRLQQTKVWQKVKDKYIPFSSNQLAEYVFCDIKDLPENSVSTREAEFLDLFQALKPTIRTVSDADIRRYEAYI